MPKPKVIIALVFVAAAAVLIGLRIRTAFAEHAEANAKAAKKKGGARVVSVSVGKAEYGHVREEILLTGSLRPKEQVDVVAKATGRVERLRFQLGDRINKGDLIAELEDDELQQQVQRATAALAVVQASSRQRQAELENAKAQLGRTESLMKEGLIPRTEYDSRRTAYEVSSAQLQLAKAQEGQAQAEINELKIRLAQTKIYAPMTGLVARRYVDEGALLSPATPIVSLVNMATMVTMANVPEREVGKLRAGNRAVVEVDAFGDRQFEGRVARIGPVLDAATRTATVEVEIPNREGGLKAEMFARVMLDLESTRQAVLIPREGLVYRGQQPGVYVTDNNRPTFRPVETGQTLGAKVEIVENLSAGDTIVLRGATMLREGDGIRIAEDTSAADSQTRTAEAREDRPAPARTASKKKIIRDPAVPEGAASGQ
ncbi:MAG: efflux RND transporter periplasmic adaptor subunit [Bryobacteraceae bacterium]